MNLTAGTQLVPLTLAYEQSGGGAEKGSRACNYVPGIWIPPPIPLWLPVDWAVRFFSANVNKHWKNTWKHAPWVMTSLLMSSPSISNSHRLFQCRYSNSRDVAASSPPSVSRPAARAPRRVCSLANLFLFHFWTLSFLLTNIQFFNWLEASREIKSLYYTERKFTFGKG